MQISLWHFYDPYYDNPMARIKIELPETFAFKTEIALRITDINYGGHLGNDALLSLIHEARVQFLKSLDCSELDIGGASLIMADAAITYRSEGFYGDILVIEIAASDITSRGFDLLFRLTNNTTLKELAIAKTGMLAFDYTARKVCTLPEAFSIRLRNSANK